MEHERNCQFVCLLTENLQKEGAGTGKNKKKCPGRNQPAMVCDSLHNRSQKWMSAIRRMADILQCSSDISLCPSLNNLISHCIQQCHLYSCLNTKVVMIFNDISHVAYDLAKNNGLEKFRDYGRLYTFFHETVPLLCSKVLALRAKFHHPNHVTIVSDLDTIYERFSNSLKVWRAEETKILSFIRQWLKQSSYVQSANYALNNVKNSYFEKFSSMTHQNTLVLAALKRLIDRIYASRNIIATLRPFGSRISFLGGPDSDLDICLSFSKFIPNGLEVPVSVIVDRRKRGKMQNEQFAITDDESTLLTSDVLKDIRKEVNQSREFRFKELILGSRIPIIRLVHKPSNVEIDLCVGNELGVQNTFLLQRYKDLDSSIHEVLLIVKHWAKSRDINDATIGMISSFSWSLLTLYALQHSMEAMHCPTFRLTDYAVKLINSHNANEASKIALYCGDEAMFNISDQFVPNPRSLVETFLNILAFYGVDHAQSFDYYNEAVDLQKINRPVSGESQSPEGEDIVDGIVSVKEEEPDVLSDGEGKAGGVEEEMEPINNAEENILDRDIDLLFPMQINNKKMKIVDPFDKGNLGRVIRAIEMQQYFMSEIRRALYYILHNKIDLLMERTDNAGKDCSYCKDIGHFAEECPEALMLVQLSKKDDNNGKPQPIQQGKKVKHSLKQQNIVSDKTQLLKSVLITFTNESKANLDANSSKSKKNNKPSGNDIKSAEQQPTVSSDVIVTQQSTTSSAFLHPESSQLVLDNNSDVQTGSIAVYNKPSELSAEVNPRAPPNRIAHKVITLKTNKFSVTELQSVERPHDKRNRDKKIRNKPEKKDSSTVSVGVQDSSVLSITNTAPPTLAQTQTSTNDGQRKNRNKIRHKVHRSKTNDMNTKSQNIDATDGIAQQSKEGAAAEGSTLAAEKASHKGRKREGKPRHYRQRAAGRSNGGNDKTTGNTTTTLA